MCKSATSNTLINQERKETKMGIQGEWSKEWLGKEGRHGKGCKGVVVRRAKGGEDWEERV